MSVCVCAGERGKRARVRKSLCVRESQRERRREREKVRVVVIEK